MSRGSNSIFNSRIFSEARDQGSQRLEEKRDRDKTGSRRKDSPKVRLKKYAPRGAIYGPLFPHEIRLVIVPNCSFLSENEKTSSVHPSFRD